MNQKIDTNKDSKILRVFGIEMPFRAPDQATSNTVALLIAVSVVIMVMKK